MLADEWLPAPADEAAEDERDDHDVVELAGDRDEVRDEVEGKREVTRERNEQRLLPARHARVAEQSAAEYDAVGDEAGERAGALVSAGDHEREDERRIQEEEDADSEERPRQEVHLPEASRPVRSATHAQDSFSSYLGDAVPALGAPRDRGVH